MLVQGDQNIRSQRKKFFRLEFIFQQARECFVAEVFDQQKPPFVIMGENRWHAETKLMEMLIDLNERHHDFGNPQSVHEDCGLDALSQAKVFSHGSVAGERFTLRFVPGDAC